jgi:hypothetical protein
MAPFTFISVKLSLKLFGAFLMKVLELQERKKINVRNSMAAKNRKMTENRKKNLEKLSRNLIFCVVMP